MQAGRAVSPPVLPPLSTKAIPPGAVALRDSRKVLPLRFQLDLNDRGLLLSSVCLRVLGGATFEEPGRRRLAPCSRRASPLCCRRTSPGAGALPSSARRPSTQIIVDNPGVIDSDIAASSPRPRGRLRTTSSSTLVRERNPRYRSTWR